MKNSDAITLIAIMSFGFEAVVKRELQALGFHQLKVSPGKVEFEAKIEDIPTANLWLRSADRVLLKMGEFENTIDFDNLFEQTKSIPWEEWITMDGEFTVTGKASRSQLGSVRACQSIVKKAVVERLKDAYQIDWFEETGAKFTIQIAMLNDVATLTLDTSGSGLNRRGYRKQSGRAALKETFAAGMVLLSFWKQERLLIDPMCGSGTILIEAALLGRNIAPGLNRDFASERWPNIPEDAWKDARQRAMDSIDNDVELKIFGYDIDEEMVRASKANARAAGVENDIVFAQQDVKDLWIDQQYGIVISNPPYGIKIGELQEINQMYLAINKTFKKKAGWSLYILTADLKFPKYFHRAWPDRTRKLHNGPIEVQYYQYYGEHPPR